MKRLATRPRASNDTHIFMQAVVFHATTNSSTIELDTTLSATPQVCVEREARMGGGASLDRSGLAALDVFEVADLVSESWLPEYRQASIDFGIDGEMLTRLPRDQLADVLRRAGVESNDDLDFLLGELDNVRRYTIRRRLNYSTVIVDRLDESRWRQIFRCDKVVLLLTLVQCCQGRHGLYRARDAYEFEYSTYRTVSYTSAAKVRPIRH